EDRFSSLLAQARVSTISSFPSERDLQRSELEFPTHELSFGARPVPGRSGSDSLLVPEPSPSRRLHSDPLRAGTSRAPDAGGFRGARRVKSSKHSLLGERAGASVSRLIELGSAPASGTA